MIAAIKNYCEQLTTRFDTITLQRKELLEKIAAYISTQKNKNQPAHIVYICSHNARRSHFGQIWAHVAADYYNVTNVHSYSGGTEVTAFHPNAISAFKRIGFEIRKTTESSNPIYQVFHDEKNPSICFSKVFDHADNPQKDFAAIMVCSEAEENCPFVPGVDLRVLTSYDDPKEFDNTPLQDTNYDERCRQIALETLYVFSRVGKN